MEELEAELTAQKAKVVALEQEMEEGINGEVEDPAPIILSMDTP